MSLAASAPAFGIYVHIPFCVTVCPYCDFNVYTGLEHTAESYLNAVLVEAGARAKKQGPFPPAGSIYFGGGTPSLVDPDLLASFLDRLRELLPVEDDAEISMEANPETVTASKLRALREAGVNRVSLGVQSFASHVLTALGRAHSPDGARASVAAAREAGFDNVNVDLIFGAPGESVEDWKQSVTTAAELETDHVSCYSLTIEQGTAFGRAVAAGQMAAPDEDDLATKYEIACDVFDDHYEISNWGRPCKHNLVYWSHGEYLGLGAGAHSHIGGVRSWNHKKPSTYQWNSTNPTAGKEELDDAGKAGEWLMLRLRLIEGVDLSEAGDRMGRDLTADAEALRTAGLATIDGTRLTLTRRGMLLENEVALKLTGIPA